VVATLVPLVSFVLILLASAAWCAVRPFRDTPAGAALFNLFGGEERGRTPAYIATGAIALAFVFSLTGFIGYTREQSAIEVQRHEHEEAIHHLKAEMPQASAEDKAKREGEIEAHEKALAQVEGRWEKIRNVHWSGHLDWLSIRPDKLPDADSGTVLQLGF